MQKINNRKVVQLLSEEVVDNIARKVAEEPIPQHVIDEAAADASKERKKEFRQMEMFDDPDWNWSGQR